MTLTKQAEKHDYVLMPLRFSPTRRRYALIRKPDFTSPMFAARTAIVFEKRKDVEEFLWGLDNWT